jgi:hypothetical protein
VYPGGRRGSEWVSWLAVRAGHRRHPTDG